MRSPMKGWHNVAPKTKKARRKMLKKCGKKCFLKPSTLAYPICPKGTCSPSQKGLRAAYARARQFNHQSIAQKAKKKMNRRSPRKSKSRRVRRRKSKSRRVRRRKSRSRRVRRISRRRSRRRGKVIKGSGQTFGKRPSERPRQSPKRGFSKLTEQKVRIAVGEYFNTKTEMTKLARIEDAYRTAFNSMLNDIATEGNRNERTKMLTQAEKFKTKLDNIHHIRTLLSSMPIAPKSRLRSKRR